MMSKRLTALAVPLVLGAALTACSAGASTHTAASSPGRESGASPDANIAAIVGCYRAHGDPSWPDPNPQGEFPLPQSQMQKSPAQEHAFTACQRYEPSGGVSVVAAP